MIIKPNKPSNAISVPCWDSTHKTFRALFSDGVYRFYADDGCWYTMAETEANKGLKTHFNSNFTVMPGDCNYRLPQIFGGRFMSELDLCAASACAQLLQNSDSPAEHAVTYKVLNITFLKAAMLGDLITIEAEITELRTTAIVVKVKAYRQPQNIKHPIPELTATGEFVFVTYAGNVLTPHNLKL